MSTQCVVPLLFFTHCTQRSLLTHSHGLLTSKSNVKHTSGGQRSTAQKGAEPKQRVARNAYERALLKLPAEVLTDNMFPTDAEIDEDFIDRGYTEDQLAACRQAYHDRWDSMFKEAKRDTVDVIGVRYTIDIRQIRPKPNCFFIYSASPQRVMKPSLSKSPTALSPFAYGMVASSQAASTI